MKPELVSAIVYVARKFHWSRKEIGDLEPNQFTEIVNELQRQEAQEKHEHLSELAVLLSAISNAPIPRKNWRGKKSSDFYPDINKGEDKGKSQNNLEKLAIKEGIIMPKHKED